jgi:predicted nucleic acid-binding protein
VQQEKPEQTPDSPKVVLDTNVLVSAFISPRGMSAQILSLVLEGKLRACYNQEKIP